MGLGALAVIHKPLTINELAHALDEESKFTQGVVKKRALVVDDSVVMRAIIRGLLEEHGFDVVGEACDVPEGIKAYPRSAPGPRDR